MPPAPPPALRTARDCARELAACLGLPPPAADADATHPALAWARSGAMGLTGDSDGPPRLACGAAASAAGGALALLRALAGEAWQGPDDGPALLGERAALLGLRRRGRVSAGGSCRLLPAADGWLAVNLPRADDRALLPAWLECDARELAWPALAAQLRARAAGAWLERARLLGLPVAAADDPDRAPAPPVCIALRGPRRPRRGGERPVVLDLSSLWAGPLCSSLLLASGARVIKLESARRPDGGRAGPAAFFDLLHAGKRSAALDWSDPDGRRALRRLFEHVDIALEASRPRALRQLGIDAEAWIAARPGRVWISISGYGRMPPGDGWVAFGDDAAAAGGLVATRALAGEAPRFCGDAIADPLAGLCAAAGGLASWQSGESRLLDVSLVASAAWARGSGDATEDVNLHGDAAGWSVEAGGERARVAPPRARAARGRARALGADTLEVLAGC
jgi:hypothetical protein